MRENCCEERNPKFLDSETANFQRLDKVCQKKFKILDSESVNFQWWEKDCRKNPKFLKSYQQLPGWDKNVETKKSKIPWIHR